MPNLFSAAPVVILAWPPAPTSGLTRKPTGAVMAHRSGDRRKHLGLGDGFEVELVEPAFERESHLLLGLADAGKDDLVRRNAGGARAPIFAARNDVRAEPSLGKRRDHGAVGIGLHRISDQRVGERLQCRRAAPRRGGTSSRSNRRRRACRPRPRSPPAARPRNKARRPSSWKWSIGLSTHQLSSPLQAQEAWRSHGGDQHRRRGSRTLRHARRRLVGPQRRRRRCCTSSIRCGSNMSATRSTSIGSATNVRARRSPERRRSMSAAAPGCLPSRSRAWAPRSPGSMPRPS